MAFRILALIATVIEGCEKPCAQGPGHPPAATVRVGTTLRQFLREGTPLDRLRRSLRRRRIARAMARVARELGPGQRLDPAPRTRTLGGVLARVHALLVAVLRGGPTLILDSCSVRARRGGDLTRPNPTGRGKKGTKHHLAVTGDGIPVACAATAANGNDTLLFERLFGRLFLAAFAVVARVRTVFADNGYDAASNRALCRRFGAEPNIHQRRQPSGSGLGQRRWPVERSNAWLLENKRLALRCDRLGFIVQALLQTACVFLAAGRLAQEL